MIGCTIYNMVRSGIPVARQENKWIWQRRRRRLREGGQREDDTLE